MKKNNIVQLIALVIIAAMAMTYWLSRGTPTKSPESQSSAVGVQGRIQSPPRTTDHLVAGKTPTPLRDRYSELKARADANDPAAASALFRDIMDCSFANNMKKTMPPRALAELERDSSNDTAEELEVHERQLGDMQKTLDFVRKQQARCADFGEAPTDAIMPAMLKAAQLGDQLATRCYLDSDSLITWNLISHPDWLEDYKNNVLAIAQRGIEHGDWRVVGLLQRSRLGPFKATLLGQILSSDPAAEYRYLKLMRLGSSGDFGASLDPMIAVSAQDLSPEQMANADAWSQQTYDNYFNGSSSNVIDRAPAACGPEF